MADPVLLVTGGAGFIGSNFVRHALARGGRPVVVDKLTYAGHRASLAGLDGLELVEADIADRAAMRAIFARHRPRIVVNFAAETHVDRSIDDPEPFVRTNVMGTAVLLDCARECWGEAPDARFLHVSTDEVFGSLGTQGRFREDSRYAPSSPYAASKAAADHLVRAYHLTYGLPTLTTNCSNNFGPYQYPEKLIPLMTLNALEGRALPVYGDGGNVRDWLFVEDHCEGISRVIAAGRPGEAYNLGGGAERTNLEVVDAICLALEARLPAAENPALDGVAGYSALRTFVADRPGHDRRYAIDATKARTELGWQPRHGFEAGIARTVDWFCENAAWCETVSRGRFRRERLGLGAPAGRA